MYVHAFLDAAPSSCWRVVVEEFRGVSPLRAGMLEKVEPYPRDVNNLTNTTATIVLDSRRTKMSLH
jgi:hypothetical protein